MPHVHQINVSDGGVPKLPVERAFVSQDGVGGDRQNDRKHHGGPRQTVCLYSVEVINALQAEGHPIEAGSAGENLTLSGLDWGGLRDGDQFRIGQDLVIEITDPATPCAKNARWFVDGDYSRMSDVLHPGSSRMYARVIEPGNVETGDEVVRVS